MLRLGTDGAEHPQVLVLGLTHGRRPRSFPCPDTRRGFLSDEPRLILKVEFALSRMLNRNRSQPLGPISP